MDTVKCSNCDFKGVEEDLKFVLEDPSNMESGMNACPNCLTDTCLMDVEETGNWYESSTGNHQGLVIEEGTGKTIAVAYDKKDAPLIAAAPDLLALCKASFKFFMEEMPNDKKPDHICNKMITVLSEVEKK